MDRIRIQETTIPEEVLGKWQKVVDIMADILTVPSAILTRVDPPQIEVLRSAQLPENPYKSGDKVSMSKHYCEAVVTENRKLQVSYAPKDPLWNEAPEIQYGMYAYLGFPLCWPNGNMFGTICVLDNKENQFGVRYEKVLFEFKELIEAHLSLLDMNEQLKKAIAEVKVLRGMLPICSFCKNIRDDSGYWNKIESYIRQHSEAEFSHSICPKCAKEHYPELDIHDE
jgi:transcriptional regulator with GAF, ATPase, and Fis domain